MSQETLNRPRCEALDAILGHQFKALDHGFVRVIDYMGDDAAVVQAARVSYGEGTTKLSDDEALTNYLLRHAHTTPFEMCELKLHCKMPMFIARQWVRHRTASINEYSARYSILKDEFYVPEKVNILAQSNVNKQGREGLLDDKTMKDWLIGSDLLNTASYDLYKHSTDNGMARELARINLPVSTYTEWYWKVNLHNLMHFLKLRADPHAQYEIRVYADIIVNIIKQWVPITYAAWLNHSFNSVKFSGKAIEAIQALIRSEYTQTHVLNTLGIYGVKGREAADVMKSLGFTVIVK
jgi:thymidylate synthase (FAD)